MKTRTACLSLMIVALIGLCVWFGWRWFTTPALPQIALDGVNEETAEVINQARQEVQSRPRSGASWGKLGMVLVANGFREQAIPCLTQASRLEPTQPRWRYWHGSTLLPSHPRDGIDHLREALRLA